MTRTAKYRIIVIVAGELGMFALTAVLVWLLRDEPSRVFFGGLYLVLFARRLYRYLFKPTEG